MKENNSMTKTSSFRPHIAPNHERISSRKIWTEIVKRQGQQDVRIEEGLSGRQEVHCGYLSSLTQLSLYPKG